ncbi:MAG: PAS domain S-box protein [Proteobacteria bacterium]|nr:PAS domain S-box protein [Pseudomonadota bacterium]
MSLFMNGDELWIGSMVGGVSVVKNDVVIRTFTTDSDDANSISSNAVSRIIKDGKGRIWLTTYGGGVNRYIGDGMFKRYPNVTNPYGAFNDLRALDIVEAADGAMWIASNGGGVTLLDPESGDTMSFQHDPNDKNTLSSDNVISLLRTDETIWIGTRDRGMNRFIKNSGTFKRYSKGQGLASDAVYGMLEDLDGNIWVSGGKGLSVLNPVKDTFQNYNSIHGLQSDDFNSGAYLKLSDGSFIFGGNNGFNAFDPGRISRNQYVPPIRLTSFSKFNKEFALPAPIDRTDLIELEYSDFVIGFEFAALDYTAPKKNRFKYKLEGFDRDWVDSGGGRQATYTNLDAGTYVFRVKGSNNDGVWNEEGTQVKLVVSPPIWATWWAYLIYILAFALGLYQLLQANTRRQQREAEKKYSERLQLYIESLEEATDCVLIADNRGRLLYANNAIRPILGQTPAEAVGKPLVSVLFENKEDAAVALAALEEQGRYHGEVTYQTDAGESMTTEVTIAAVRELSEQGSAYVSISRDITERKTIEAELENHRRNLEHLVGERTSALEKEIVEHKAAEDDLANSLEEKELLLKEVHHRVKNNMQVISSLLNIQAETAGNEALSDLLGASQQRIKSMSLIHENLYQSDNFQEIDFEDYIKTLANSLCRFYSVPGVDILLDVNVDNVYLDLETAVPCGLIINELISNSLKHAFKDRQGSGTISIDFRTVGCSNVLDIRDDGKGLPEDFRLEDSSSMGMEIVSILTQQLDGKIQIIGTQGAAFKISFPRKVKHEL